MKKRKMKLISLLCAAAMAMSMFTGCGDSSQKLILEAVRKKREVKRKIPQQKQL